MGLGGVDRKSDGYHETTETVDLIWTSRQRVLEAKVPQLYETCGGPVATRTPDLYRVKVAL